MSTVMMICQRTALLKARLIVEFVTLSIIEPLNVAFGKGPKKARAFSTIPSPQVKRIYANFNGGNRLCALVQFACQLFQMVVAGVLNDQFAPTFAIGLYFGCNKV